MPKHHNDSADRPLDGARERALSSDGMNIQMRALFADVDAALARERGARSFLRGLKSSHRWLIAALAAAALIALVRAGMPSAVDLHFGVRLWTCLIVYALLFGALAAQALRPLQRIEPNRTLALGLGGLALIAPFALAMWPTRPEFAGTPPYDCLPIGGLIGGTLLLILRALDRADEAEPRTIMFASAAASLAANIALVFHCADDRPLHLLIGHAPLGLALWFAYRKLEERRAPFATTCVRSDAPSRPRTRVRRKSTLRDRRCDSDRSEF